MDELKPCPFCGGEAELDCDATLDISWSIDNATAECQSCLSKSDTFWADNLDKQSCQDALRLAVEAWNKRSEV